MSYNNFMNKFKSFFGLPQSPPQNEFRNPIWGTDDDDDDDDELYSKHYMESFNDPSDMHQEFRKQMQDMLKSFGNMFGDMKSFLDDDIFDFQNPTIDIPSEDSSNNNIRDYYLKPGYNTETKDGDLDGKITSQDLSDLYKSKRDSGSNTLTPFIGKIVPGKSFCRTIITTSVTKPDGTIETRRIVKNGNEVIEETTTSTDPTPINAISNPLIATGMMCSQVLSDIASFLRNFN